MKLKINPIVYDELLESFTYYQNKTGSGDPFFKDYNGTLDRIEEHPKHYQLVKDTEFRRCNFSKFPYCIFYKIMTDHTFILALAHQSRKPRF